MKIGAGEPSHFTRSGPEKQSRAELSDARRISVVRVFINAGTHVGYISIYAFSKLHFNFGFNFGWPESVFSTRLGTILGNENPGLLSPSQALTRLLPLPLPLPPRRAASEIRDYPLRPRRRRLRLRRPRLPPGPRARAGRFRPPVRGVAPARPSPTETRSRPSLATATPAPSRRFRSSGVTEASSGCRRVFDDRAELPHRRCPISCPAPPLPFLGPPSSAAAALGARARAVSSPSRKDTIREPDSRPTTLRRPGPRAATVFVQSSGVLPLKMSLVTDSPVHSSSSDDFASYLDAQLASGSSGSSANDETDDEIDHESERIKRGKVENLEILEEPEGSTSGEYSEQIVETTIKQDSCSHPGSFGGLCMRCGKPLEEESGVTFGYIHKGLRLADDEIARLRNTDLKNLLRYKKLYLILDLDHTLLNSTSLAHISPEEEHLRGKVDSWQDVSKGSLFVLEHMHTMTKLRPFVRTFLKEASDMFEMYIYTMGDRSYAREMAKLLDPKREYFHERVISRDDGTQRHQKGLDVVLGQENCVVILDDTEQAWTKHKDNLILMERYHYFASSCQQFGFSCKSLSEMETDESESDGALAIVMGVLKRIHTIFFHELEDEFAGRDVRQVLKTLRKEVLGRL
ncbi:hypothetical protein NL676_034315 [Syzygium grande]|nr:hypothetical protein NL676_034315 [Syzygium grande]